MIAAASWRMMHQKLLDWSPRCLYRHSALCILGRDDVSAYVLLIARHAGSPYLVLARRIRIGKKSATAIAAANRMRNRAFYRE